MNAYLNKQKLERSAVFVAGWEEGAQYVQDCMMIALHNRGIGEKRMMEIMEDFKNIHNEHIVCFDPKEAEADYHRELLDREMKAILKDKAQPFEERYPVSIKIRYDKPLRERHRKKR